MINYRKDPTPQYEKKSPAIKPPTPIKITSKMISDLVEIVKENKTLLKKAGITYQL